MSAVTMIKLDKTKTVSSKVTSGVAYLDPILANSIEKDMEKQLKIIASVTKKCYKLLLRAEVSGDVKGDKLPEQFKRARKGLRTRSLRAKQLNKKLVNSYSKDTQDFVAQFLTKQLTDLESRVAALEKSNG